MGKIKTIYVYGKTFELRKFIIEIIILNKQNCSFETILY